ncbi:MAG TPA: hypothetical protein VHI98_05770 [Vicinamibacterales bacterium]|nr:hypothetical protein [Vicinamibacterales bacterium]HEX2460997.1 hypothetical protein [Vicinamibacterales bacterium]
MAARDTEGGHSTAGFRGWVLGAKPELSFGLSWLPDAFDRVWTLALSGHLKFAHVYFTKPHYNSGLVVSASFSNELEE